MHASAFVGICRRAGFEPALRTESFHTFWTLRDFAADPVVALAPRSLASDLPDGLVTVPFTEPTDPLETHLLWRDPMPPTVEAFRATARAVYAAR